MATTIVMPQMGYDMREGTVVKWRKQEGEPVTRGEVIAEIETDKATVEMEAYSTGVLGRIVAEEGRTVPVGDLIAVITEPGEAVPATEELTGRTAGPSAPGPGRRPAPSTRSCSLSSSGGPRRLLRPAKSGLPPSPGGWPGKRALNWSRSSAPAPEAASLRPTCWPTKTGRRQPQFLR